jgi:RNA polymerase sigma-70 factor, ECF subfamily
VDFYQVYDDYHDRIRQYILAAVKNRWVADDLVQETFLRVLQNSSQIREQAKLSAWIYRIAANLCQDHFRRARRNVIPFDENAAREFPGDLSLEKQIEQYELSLLVQDLIKLLPEPLRQVLFLCDIKQTSYQEAGELLGLSLENIKVRLHRARKRLKALLEENGQPECSRMAKP